MALDTRQHFYVYQHVKPETGAPFYVGKGKGSRATCRHNRNPHWQNIVNKHGFRVEIIFSGMDEEMAFLAETEVIDLYRLRGKHLCNMTAGGDGVRLTGDALTNFLEAQRSPEVNKKRSKSLSEHWAEPGAKARRVKSLTAALNRPEVKQRLSAASAKSNADPAVRDKISASAKAYWRTDGVKERRLQSLLAASKAACARPVLCVERDIAFPAFSDATKWLRANGKTKASHSALVNACKGKLKSAYGYSWRYADTGVTRAAEKVTVVL